MTLSEIVSFLVANQATVQIGAAVAIGYLSLRSISDAIDAGDVLLGFVLLVIALALCVYAGTHLAVTGLAGAGAGFVAGVAAVVAVCLLLVAVIKVRQWFKYDLPSIAHRSSKKTATAN